MLLSGWFLALLVTVAVAVPAVWVWYELRRRRRARRGVAVSTGWRLGAVRVGVALLTLAASVAAAAAAVNRHYSYIPSFNALLGNISPDLVGHPLQEEAAALDRDLAARGMVVKVSVPGPASGVAARDAYVYLPPQYDDPARPGQRFPVLYLLHGSPGVAADWLRGGEVDRAMDGLLRGHTIAPFIVVLPDVNGGYAHDSECIDVPGGPLVQTYLVRDVVAYVDAHFRSIPERGARAIGGLSSGGYCAINLGFRHQDTYSAIVSHSGYYAPDQNHYTGDLFHRDRALRRANTPADYLATIPVVRPLGVYLDVGASDRQSRAESAAVSAILVHRGLAVTFHVFPGEQHTWATWRRNLHSSLPWLSAWFASQSTTPPAA